MKHPTPEDWMSYLYDELEPTRHGELQQHLGDCRACQNAVARWRGAAAHLDTYEVRRISPSRETWPVAAKRALAAAAALVVLATGFALGRATAASRAEVATLRQQMAALKTDLDPHIQAVAQAEIHRQVQPLAAAIAERLSTMETQQAVSFAGLRRELETVAVTTEAGFRLTETQLAGLGDRDNNASGDFIP